VTLDPGAVVAPVPWSSVTGSGRVR